MDCGRVEQHPVVGATSAPATARQVAGGRTIATAASLPTQPSSSRRMASRATGSRRVTCPTRRVSRAAAAASTRARPSATVRLIGFSTKTCRPAGHGSEPDGDVGAMGRGDHNGIDIVAGERVVEISERRHSEVPCGIGGLCRRRVQDPRRDAGRGTFSNGSTKATPEAPCADQGNADHRSRAERCDRIVSCCSAVVTSRPASIAPSRPASTIPSHMRQGQDLDARRPGDRRINGQSAAGGGHPAQLRQVRVHVIVRGRGRARADKRRHGLAAQRGGQPEAPARRAPAPRALAVTRPTLPQPIRSPNPPVRYVAPASAQRS